MRELTSHQINGCNDGLTITAVDPPGSGGACHRYEINGFDPKKNPSADLSDRDGVFTSKTILFQNGPLLEAGPNGLTHETLLAILEDRLAGFQSGKFACQANADALEHIRAAQRILKARTKERLSRGVEGTLRR